MTQTRKRVVVGALAVLAALCFAWGLLLALGFVESGRTFLVQGIAFPAKARAVDVFPWIVAGVVCLAGALYAAADEIDRWRSKG